MCNQTKLIHITHLPYDIIHKCFLAWSHIHYIFITTIFIIVRLCHLPSLNLILLRAKSAASQKSNPLPLLMGCDIALIISVVQRWLQSVANRQLTPHFYSVNYSIWTGHYQNELYQITWLHHASNYSYHQGISICKLGEITTLYMERNDRALLCVLFACVLVYSPVKAVTALHTVLHKS